MSITLTEAAAARVQAFLDNRGSGVGLRLGVKTTGCSGMAYVIEFADEIDDADKVFSDKGINVLVDPKSLIYLDGTELDYTNAGLTEGFKFNTPNVKDSCGCGESFTVSTYYLKHELKLAVLFMQSANLSDDFFVLFDFPVSFDVVLCSLAERYREAQRAVHPDKFANASEAERRLSAQLAARVNEAYRVLKDPLARGRYLLELRGVDLDDMDTTFDGAFLMEQMELRERLADVKGSANPHQQLEIITRDINAQSKSLIAQMAKLLEATDMDSLQQARVATRKLQFFRRLHEEVDALDDELSEL